MDRMATAIEWSGAESAQLLSGHRGTGKTTELQRLRRMLEDRGHIAVHIDMEDHLHLSSPVDVASFLLAATAAIEDALRKHCALPAVGGSIFERFSDWLQRTQLEVGQLSLRVPAAELKLNLKESPAFKDQLARAVTGHLGSLTQEVRQYLGALGRELRAARGDDIRVVVLLDSVEHIRGSVGAAAEVMGSVEQLFSAHADKLRLPGLHMVYTVPPWLQIRAPGVASGFDLLTQIPCVPVADRDGGPDAEGVDGLRAFIAAREPEWAQVFGDAGGLDRLIAASGGYLRDLLRLVQVALLDARGGPLPLSAAAIDRAVAEVRRSYLPITAADAAFLWEVHQSHRLPLEALDQLPELARLFENMLVLTYYDGAEWYDVHPLVRDEVRALVKA